MALRSSGRRILLEQFEANPFLTSFYSNPREFAFETEITFLLQHYSSIHASKHQPLLVLDYALIQDLAYAQINLRFGKLRAFTSVWREVLRQVGRPSMIIFLSCSIDQQMARIRGRQRWFERKISPAYLCKLNSATSSAVARSHPASKILRIDSGEVDFVNDPSDIRTVRSLVKSSLGKF